MTKAMYPLRLIHFKCGISAPSLKIQIVAKDAKSIQAKP